MWWQRGRSRADAEGNWLGAGTGTYFHLDLLFSDAQGEYFYTLYNGRASGDTIVRRQTRISYFVFWVVVVIMVEKELGMLGRWFVYLTRISASNSGQLFKGLQNVEILSVLAS